MSSSRPDDLDGTVDVLRDLDRSLGAIALESAPKPTAD
jgi:hypothetical protein